VPFGTLVLASQSPRRAELLRQAGVRFVIRAAPVDETPLPNERPEDYVVRLAERKAMAVEAAADEIVLAADTTVVIGGAMLGKPADAREARHMLVRLSGRRHQVLTGICLRYGGQAIRDWATTHVWFSALSRREIHEYVASGEPMDKAGAYAIQGLASRYVERIEGCYFNVVGLPVALVYHHLQAIRAHAAEM
jgi:septum formation protein